MISRLKILFLLPALRSKREISVTRPLGPAWQLRTGSINAGAFAIVIWQNSLKDSPSGSGTDKSTDVRSSICMCAWCRQAATCILAAIYYSCPAKDQLYWEFNCIPQNIIKAVILSSTMTPTQMRCTDLSENRAPAAKHAGSDDRFPL